MAVIIEIMNLNKGWNRRNKKSNDSKLGHKPHNEIHKHTSVIKVTEPNKPKDIQ